MLLSEGQISDYKGTELIILALPKTNSLLADRDYNADWFRAALAVRDITPCIPSRASRNIFIFHDKTLIVSDIRSII